MLGDVVHLLQERQVAVRLDVAHRAGIAIPVPSAAEVAALLDYADVLEAGLAQAGAHQESAEATADDDDLDLVVEGRAFDLVIHVRVVDVARKLGRDLDVLLVAILPDALVALGKILSFQLLRVEIDLAE